MNTRRMLTAQALTTAGRNLRQLIDWQESRAKILQTFAILTYGPCQGLSGVTLVHFGKPEVARRIHFVLSRIDAERREPSDREYRVLQEIYGLAANGLWPEVWRLVADFDGEVARLDPFLLLQSPYGRFTANEWRERFANLGV